MSKEKGTAKQSLSSEGTSTGTNTANLEQQQQQQLPTQPQTSSTQQHQQSKNEATAATDTAQSASSEAKTGRMQAPSVATGAPVAEGSAPTVAESTSADSGEPTRQVIAVSASKSPAAFFNLARKFLVTNEMCDLSALEGAIVSAVDAAHLLERSQLATIVRIHTSYVSVEPKRKKQSSPQLEPDVVLVQPSPAIAAGGGAAGLSAQASEAQTMRADEGLASSSSSQTASAGTASPQPSRRGSSGGRELRRARIVVTVRRTESYKRWLEENPLQAIIASEADDDAVESEGAQPPTGRPKRP